MPPNGGPVSGLQHTNAPDRMSPFPLMEFQDCLQSLKSNILMGMAVRFTGGQPRLRGTWVHNHLAASAGSDRAGIRSAGNFVLIDADTSEEAEHFRFVLFIIVEGGEICGYDQPVVSIKW